MVDRVGRNKVEYFSAPGSRTSSIPLKDPESQGERKQKA